MELFSIRIQRTFQLVSTSKSVTGRKLQHIRGELFGVIGVESFGKMLIMSRGDES